jgi:hypothetical protein
MAAFVKQFLKTFIALSETGSRELGHCLPCGGVWVAMAGNDTGPADVEPVGIPAGADRRIAGDKKIRDVLNI